MNSMAVGVTEGLAIGLSTGANCLGWCLPALGPYVATRTDGGRESLRAVLAFNAGRLGGYLVILTASLALGAALADAAWLRPVSAAALVLLGTLMLLHAVRVNFPGRRVCRSRLFARFLDRLPGAAGLLIGLSPCPPLLLAAAVIAGRGPAEGLSFGIAFFAATSAFLVPLAILGHPRVRPLVSGVAGAAAVLAAPWFIAHGVALLASPGVQ
jgi:sulfite exporter TauE/SafE